MIRQIQLYFNIKTLYEWVITSFMRLLLRTIMTITSILLRLIPSIVNSSVQGEKNVTPALVKIIHFINFHIPLFKMFITGEWTITPILSLWIP